MITKMNVNFYSVQDIANMLHKPAEVIEEYIRQNGIMGVEEGEPFLVAEGNLYEFLKGIDTWSQK